MIDALVYAVRDGIRSAGISYDAATCELMDDGRPPPRAGNYFAAVHGGDESQVGGSNDNNLDLRFGLKVTLTMRVVNVSVDRMGDQLVYRNAVRELARKQGFSAKCDQLRNLLHMNWNMVVVQGRTPNSANDNIVAWETGVVYGFVEPMRYRGREAAVVVGGEWFGAEPDAEDVGVRSELRFADARRLQPQTQASGPFA